MDVLSAKLTALLGPKGCIGPEDCQPWQRDRTGKNFAGKSLARPGSAESDGPRKEIIGRYQSA